MSIPIKSAREIALMREAGRRAANILARLCRAVAPGVTTYDLDQLARELMVEYEVTSAAFNYPGPQGPFPSYVCLSVNDVVIHGIGRLQTRLQPGDVISLDVAVVYQGYIGDNTRSVGVGHLDPALQRLLDVSEAALQAGIAEARPGNRVGAISHAIESAITPHGYGIVRDFVGHGVGRTMHEPPQIPNFGPRKKGERLGPGMTLAIEPMVTLGRPEIDVDDDGWTARTRDGQPAAHFEHTVLVTADAPEILTRPDPGL